MKIREVMLALVDAPTEDDRLERDPLAVERLADDIRANGLINPPSLEEKGVRFECVAGWTRILAVKRLGELAIMARVYPSLDPSTRRRIRLAENLQRSDLTPIEEAIRLIKLRDDEKLDNTALAQIVRRSEGWVEQRLQLLAIPDELQALVHTRELALSAALVLARCDEPEHRAYLTRYAVDGGATVATIRAWVEEWRIHHASGAPGTAPLPPMPVANQPLTVLIPCARCHTAHEYRTTCVVRVCQPCGRKIADEQADSTAEQTATTPG